jgi:hypothetical protein
MMPEEVQPDDALESAPPSDSSATTLAVSSPFKITEDLALAKLKEQDLPPEAIEDISHDAAVMMSRKVRLALAAHPRAPRRIALRVIRELYTFELMKFALVPTAAADLRRVADELLVSRLPSIPMGARISLARRCSSLVAGALLLDKEARIWQTVLNNPRLTEFAIVRALHRSRVSALLVEAVCYHPSWSPRPEIRMALLCNEHTPLAKVIEFAKRVPPTQIRDIVHASRLPEKTKQYLERELETREKLGKGKHVADGT